MKRALLIIAIVIGGGLFTGALWASSAYATDARTGETVSIGRQESIDSSLYAAGQNITIDGTVQGDVFCAGMQITISGTVQGDVLCAGQTVLVNGSVTGDVRLAGSQIDLSGTVDGSATLLGQSVVLGGGGSVGRDLTLAGGSAHISGKVGRDVLGAADSLVLAGTIGRDLDASIRTLTLASNAEVGRNLTYRSENTADLQSGATVGGTTNYTAVQPDESQPTLAEQLRGVLWGFIAMLFVGLVAVAFVPRAFDAASEPLRTRILISFAAGAAVLFGVPLLAIFLLVSLIGLPLGIILLLLWGAALISALPVAAYALGWVLVEKMGWPQRARRLTSIFLGLLVLTIVGLIPYVGGPIVFLAVVCGLGSGVVAVGKRLSPPKIAAKDKKGA